jgi:hypothetical protein
MAQAVLVAIPVVAAVMFTIKGMVVMVEAI